MSWIACGVDRERRMKHHLRPDITARKLHTDHKRHIGYARTPPPRLSSIPTTASRQLATQTAADAVTAEEARALEAQTQRRVARRAEQQKRVKELARKAIANLGRGGWKESRTEDSANFAREFKLGVAKKARDRVMDDRPRVQLEMRRAAGPVCSCSLLLLLLSLLLVVFLVQSRPN